MSDEDVREIQLSGKQLVFLLMAAVVFAVAVFLLGVSVGRGVRSSAESGATTASNAVPTSMPPATKAAPEKLEYHDALQGGGRAASPGATAPPAGNAPPAQSPPQPTNPPPANPAATTPATATTQPPASSSPPPAQPPAVAAPPPAPPPASTGGFYVQVASFRDRANAEKLVQDLKAQGLPAALQVVSSSPPNRVRVGPYADRPAAEAVAKRLAKYGPMVTR
jgi:DedD protein